MSNCPTCNGPIINGLCCNGTPKECLQKWWDEHGHEPLPVFRPLDELDPFQSFHERLAAIEARAQKMDELLTAQTEAIEAGLKVAQMQEERIERLETAVRHGCPAEVS